MICSTAPGSAPELRDGRCSCSTGRRAETSSWRSCRFGGMSRPESSGYERQGRCGDLGSGWVAPARLPAGDRCGRLRGIVVKQLPAQILDHQVMLPAPGQGALALEIHRSLSIEMRQRLALLDNPVARAESLVERGFLGCPGSWLHRTGGGPCSGHSSPWYKSRFDSDGGNWENVTEQLVRTHQSRLSPTAGGARIIH